MSDMLLEKTIEQVAALRRRVEQIELQEGATQSSVVIAPGVINVRDYGALGDGVADDTAALQAALDAAHAAGGGTVWLPVGVYLISNTLIYYANITLLGMRGASVIQNDLGRSDYIMLIPDAGSTVENVVIEGLTFDQRSDEFGFTSSDPLLSIREVASITLKRCAFRNAITLAVWADTRAADTTTRHVRIENCSIENSLGGGIGFFGNVQDLVIHNNRIENCQDDSIALLDLATGERPTYAVISKNTLLNNNRRNETGSTPHAVLIYGGENVIITDNLIDGTVASAISVQYGTSHSDHVIVANNIVRNAGITEDDTSGVPGHGIMALTSSNVQIIDNVVVGSRQWGIVADTIDWLTIVHNRCEDNTHGRVTASGCKNVVNLFNGEDIPTFPNGLRLNGVGVGAIEMQNLTIANNGTAQFTTVSAYQQAMGVAFVVSIEDGSVAIFSLTGGNLLTFEIADPQGQFSNTQGTAGMTNIYNEGSSPYGYYIENMRGGERNYCLFLFMNRS